ncbi:MAG: TraR/DksA family transcriptional regulator [Pseudomonadota bacterium]
MQEVGVADAKRELEAQKALLEERLERIKANVRRGFNADSAEMAKELEDQEVVDALGNEATEELSRITAALERIANGDFGKCLDCGEAIPSARLTATPFAERCIDCANEAERCS